MYVSENPNRSALAISDKNSEGGFTSHSEPECLVAHVHQMRDYLSLSSSCLLAN
jgi:hypothetical protein